MLVLLLLLITGLFAVESVWSQSLDQAESSRLLGRCMVWIEMDQGKDFNVSEAYTNCSEFTAKINNFFNSHKRGPNDTIPENELSDFISQLLHIQPNKKPLLWSGAYPETQVAASQFGPFVSLEATLLGYCMNGWDMCAGLSEGQKPAWKHCWVLNEWWRIASGKYASLTSGIVTVLVNASRSPIFRQNSIFVHTEVPMLQSGQVKLLDLHLMDAYKIHTSNACDLPELDKPKGILKQKNITFNCEVNSRMFLRVRNTKTAKWEASHFERNYWTCFRSARLEKTAKALFY